MRNCHKTLFMLLGAACLPFLSPGETKAAHSIGVGTGFDYSSGDYGESTTTEMIYIPVTLKYQNDLADFKLTIPYVSISSEGGVVGGSEVIVVDSEDQTTESETQSGLGDVMFAATYYLYEGSTSYKWAPMVDLIGKVKFPTADEEKALGTGEYDYYLQTDLTWVLTKKIALFGALGYKFAGSPEDYDLNNVFYGSLGTAYQIRKGLSTGLMYDLREASTDSGTGRSEATAYVSHKFTPKIKGLLYGVKGFSDGSADYGIGMTVSYSMDLGEFDWIAPIKDIFNN